MMDHYHRLYLPEGPEGDYAHVAVAQGGVEPEGQVYEFHTHHRAQLFMIVSGALRLETETGIFVVPPERAVFVPSSVRHKVTYLQNTECSYFFFKPDAVAGLTAETCVIRITALLRALTDAFRAIPLADAGGGRANRLAAVILDELQASPTVPFHLPMPRAPRLRAAAEEMREDPGGDWSLSRVAGIAARSPRSVQRDFRAETGLGLRAWLYQAKLIRAVELLAAGEPVGNVAFSLSYASPSAFIAGFRRALGASPGRYFEG